jgi:hypothetical protein
MYFIIIFYNKMDSWSLNFTINQVNFSSTCQKWDIMDRRHLSIIFLIFLILLKIHIGQFEIIFNKFTEIHLNY